MGTICTFSGNVFDFENPWASTFSVHDIAHALSQICRFTGHTQRFYSVAQHSVHVSEIVPREHALAGLMHDAAEAFIGDMSSPLKRMIPQYKEIEHRIESAVLNRFGLYLPLHPCVKEADLIMLKTEQRDLMHAGSRLVPWHAADQYQPLLANIEPWTPYDAYHRFLLRFQELTSYPV